MRIISGTARGRRLHTPADGGRTIRPTSDRAREALFSIIGPEIVDSSVLDLFAGTGAFGCEALSRGAAFVLFIDSNAAALQLIASNVALIQHGSERSSRRRADLSREKPLPIHSSDPSFFDFVFIDPPYGKDLADTPLRNLDKSSVLHERSLIIVEENKEYRPPTGLARLAIVDKRRYGEANFTFFQLKNEY